MGQDRETPGTADPGETQAQTADAGTIELAAAPDLSAADVPSELLAQTLGQYIRAWLLRIRGGDSGVLPVVLAIVIVAVVFQIITPEHAFLRPSNLVYIFGLSTVYMVLAIAETVVLLLAEIDLSVGAVALIGGVIAFKLVQSPGPGWPWWAAIIAAVVVCGLIGALQGTLTSRLRIQSFVVTLAGFLLYSGILIIVLGGADGFVNLSSNLTNQRIIYNMVQGVIVPVAGWVVLAVVVVVAGAAVWLRAAARRRQGLVAPPPSLTAIRIAVFALVGVAVVIVCNVNRGTSLVIGAGGSVGDPDRARRPGRLDSATRADPLRPLRLCHRRQPRGSPARWRQPGLDPHLVLRAVLGDRRPRRHPAGFLFLRRVQHQYGRPRSARPVHRRRRRHRRSQPLRRPG